MRLAGFDFPGNGCPVCGIANDRRNAGEVAAAERGGRDQRLASKRAGDLASRFPVEEEEGLVLPYGTAEVCAVLIAIESGRLCAGDMRLERIQRGERIVAIEPPGAAVESVGAALGGEIDLAARRSADIRRVGAALNLELHDGVDRRREAEAVAIQIHRFDAVVVEAILRVASAIRRHSDRLPKRAAKSPHGDAPGRSGIHARGQAAQVARRICR